MITAPARAPRLDDSLRDGLSALRRELDAHGFTWQTAQQRLGIQWHVPFPPESLADTATPHVAAGEERPYVDTLLRLFMLGETVARGELEAGLSPAVVAVLAETGLVLFDDDAARTPFFVMPWRGFVFVCDLPRDQRELDAVRIPDPSTFFTCEFLQPRDGEPTGRMLDIGCGCGAVALEASHSFDEVHAVDITERAVDFTRFNAALNGVAVACSQSRPPLDGLPQGPFDLVTFVLPLITPYFQRGDDALAIRTELGRELLLATYARLPSLLGPSGRAVLWHQVLLDPPDFLESALADAGVAGELDVVANTFNLGHGAWAFARVQVTRGDAPRCVTVPSPPDFFSHLQSRGDLERALATAALLGDDGSPRPDARPHVYEYVTCGKTYAAAGGTLELQPGTIVAGASLPDQALELLQACDGTRRVEELDDEAGLLGALCGMSVVYLTT